MAAMINSSSPALGEAAPVVFADTGSDSRLSKRFGPIAVATALVLALVTFVIIAGLTPIIPTTSIVLWILLGDGVVTLVLLALITAQVRKLLAARRAARAGARLHTRVVALFSLVAAIPALVTAIVAATSVERVINPGFMQSVASVFDDASHAADHYRESQCQTLLREAELTATDLSRGARLATADSDLMRRYLNDRAHALNFSVAAILNTDGRILQMADGSAAALIARPSASDFADAGARQPFCGLLSQGDTFIALRPIEGLDKTFFYAGRAIDPLANKVPAETAQVAQAFAGFEAHRHVLELGFAALFIMLSLSLLISAVWMGLTFADQLVGPIRRLIRATDEVAGGNLYVQVPTHKSEGDLAHLGETFNKMTGELRLQHRNLTAANALADERRAFIEAALSGVPAGVIGVDQEGVVAVGNAAAERLLCPDPKLQPLLGRRLDDLHPKLAQILEEARATRARLHQGQATLFVNGRERLLNVRVTGDPQRADQGSVITLDDITDLVSAQRSAAWADVARRIAHEIKNPLTPIQLSAERLKRRYGRHIVEGKDVFDQCTDTIIRQVDDIKRMVDEFSNFARMPKARLANDDLSDCLRQAMFLARVGRADIEIEDEMPADAVMADFDRRLLSQALTNVLKNAGEGIDARPATDEPGRIRVTLGSADGFARIAVSDNGKGFPAEDRQKLTEPYVTTRAEGTGLGLPIVIKILEDHHGTVELLDGLERADGGRGAQVVLTMPLGALPEAAKETRKEKRELT